MLTTILADVMLRSRQPSAIPSFSWFCDKQCWVAIWGKARYLGTFCYRPQVLSSDFVCNSFRMIFEPPLSPTTMKPSLEYNLIAGLSGLTLNDTALYLSCAAASK